MAASGCSPPRATSSPSATAPRAGSPAATACSRALERELGIRAGETTADGRFSLETRTDVGAGAISPAIRIDTLVYGPLTEDKALHIVGERRAAATAGSAG